MAKKRDVSRFLTGQMVLSDAGHDRGKIYVILKIQGETLWVADGVRKTVEQPKKKNIRHVRRMNYIDQGIDNKLKNACPLNNEDICKAIQLFEMRGKVIGG